MKVLMISGDPNVLVEGSAVRERIREYGAMFEELHIVVCARDLKKGAPAVEKLAKNTFAYATGATSVVGRLRAGLRVGTEIVRHWKSSRPASDKRYVVTAQDPFELGLVAWRISSRFDIPLQLQVHTDFLSPYFKKGSFKNRARLIVAHMLIPRAQSIRVVSERIKRSLLSRYHRITPNIHVVPIFVDVDALRSVQSADLRKKYPGFDRIILMASRLSSEKNIPMAIRAFREVVKKHPRTGLLIIGGGPEESRLKAYVDKLDLKGKVFFGGWQSSIAPFAKAAHIFLSTSLYEGYGLSVVEAAITGTLVVSSDVGIATELLPERCRFEPRDEEDLQWILCRAVGESRERQESLRFIRDHIQYVTYKNKEAQLKALKETFETAVR